MSRDVIGDRSYSSIIAQYVKSTQDTTVLLGVAAMLIILFIKNLFFTSIHWKNMYFVAIRIHNI